MIYKILMIFGIIFSFSGCFSIGSGTSIEIQGLTQSEYEQIKEDIRDVITKLNPPYDCEFNKEIWQENRNAGQLICHDTSRYQSDREAGSITVYQDDNNMTVIAFGDSHRFWIPTQEFIVKEIITEEHQKIQKLFLILAAKYKKEYSYSRVEVIFYHHDIAGDSRKIFSK